MGFEMTPEQATTLRNAGHIDDNQFQQILAMNTPPPAPMPGLGGAGFQDTTPPVDPTAGVPGRIVSNDQIDALPISDTAKETLRRSEAHRSALFAPSQTDARNAGFNNPQQSPAPAAGTTVNLRTGDVRPTFGGAPETSGGATASPAALSSSSGQGALPAYLQNTGMPRAMTAIPVGSTEQRTSGFTPNPADLKAMQGAAAAEKKATDELARIRVEQADVQVKADAKIAALKDEHLKQETEKRVAEQVALDAERRKVDDATAEFKAAKIDPNRFWTNQGTGGQIAAAFAIGLGALGSAYTKGPNHALSIINDAIKRDVDAQMTDRETKRDAASMARTAFSDLRAQIGDDRQTRLVLENLKTEKVMADLQAELGKYKAPEARANADLLLAALQAKNAERNMRLQELMTGKVVTQTNFVNVPSDARGNPMLSAVNSITGVDAFGQKTDPKVARANQEFSERYKNISENVRSLREMVKNKGTWEMTGAHNDIMNSLVYNIAIDYAKIVDPESIAREGEVAAAQKYMLPIQGLFVRNATADTILKALQTQIDQRALTKSNVPWRGSFNEVPNK